MTEDLTSISHPCVLVLADVASNAQSLVERVLRPAKIDSWTEDVDAPNADLLVVDITQIMGDPLVGLRNRREHGDHAPAIVLAAHFPQSKLRDFLRLGVGDVLLKPYRPQELIEAIQDLYEARSQESDKEKLTRQLESSREHVRHRSEEIHLLSEIGRAVVSLGDLERILPRVVEAAAFMTEAEEANIYLADDEIDGLALRASKQAGAQKATLQRLRVEDSLVGQVFDSGQPVLRQPSLEAGPVKIQTGFVVRALAQVPIRKHNKICGVLGVYNHLATRTFNEHHLTLLMALADWAGVALERADLLLSKGAPRAIGEDKLERAYEAQRIVDLMLKEEFGPLQGEQARALKELRRTLTPLTGPLESQELKPLVDLSVILQDVIQLRANTLEARQHEIEIGPSLAIPPFPGDPVRTKQVVDALLASAISRSSNGRIVLNSHRFEVQDGKANGLAPPEHLELKDGVWIAVTVSDTSPGLPDVIQQALNSPEVDISAGKQGPGLSMGEVRLVASSLGGVVWHDQTPAGTTLIFAIPTT